MSRSCLTIQEAEAALPRGKSVEIFLGGFEKNSVKCIRWATFSASNDEVAGRLWGAYDQRSADYLDVYTFDSPSGEHNEQVKSVTVPSIESAANMLGISDLKFVNEGVVQDEYISYFEQRT